jgi:H+/gluconate symporter-like permease
MPPSQPQSFGAALGLSDDDTARAIIIGVVLGTLGLICCILLIVMIAQRKKRKNPRPDNRLPAPAKTELYQKKSTQTKLTSPASPMSPQSPGSSSRTQVL